MAEATQAARSPATPQRETAAQGAGAHVSASGGAGPSLALPTLGALPALMSGAGAPPGAGSAGLMLALQETAGNAAVARLIEASRAGAGPAAVGRRLGIQRQDDGGTQRNDPRALAGIRTEELFRLYLGDQPDERVDGVRLDREWLSGAAGTQALRRAIQRNLDAKVREGQRDHLAYFRSLVDRVGGPQDRVQWLRDAVGYRLRQVESTQGREVARAAQVGGEILASVAPALGLPRPMAEFLFSRGISFGSGIWEGMGRQIEADELAELGGRFLLGWGESIVANPVFLAGVSVGILEDAWETARSIWPLLEREQFNRMAEEVAALGADICGPQGGQVAYRLGVHVGSSSAARLERTLRSEWWQLPFQLGRLVGPIIFEAAISLMGGEAVVLASIARQVRPLIARSPRLARLARLAPAAGGSGAAGLADEVPGAPGAAGGSTGTGTPPVRGGGHSAPSAPSAPSREGPSAPTTARPSRPSRPSRTRSAGAEAAGSDRQAAALADTEPGMAVAAGAAARVRIVDGDEILRVAQTDPRRIRLTELQQGEENIFEVAWREGGGQGRVAAFASPDGSIHVATRRLNWRVRRRLYPLLAEGEARIRAAERQAAGLADTDVAGGGASLARPGRRGGERASSANAEEPAGDRGPAVDAPRVLRQLQLDEVLRVARSEPGRISVVESREGIDALFDWEWRRDGNGGSVIAYQRPDGSIRVAVPRLRPSEEDALYRAMSGGLRGRRRTTLLGGMEAPTGPSRVPEPAPGAGPAPSGAAGRGPALPGQAGRTGLARPAELLEVAEQDLDRLRAIRGELFDAEFPPAPGEDVSARIAHWRGDQIVYNMDRLPADVRSRLDELNRQANRRRQGL